MRIVLIFGLTTVGVGSESVGVLATVLTEATKIMVHLIMLFEVLAI